MWSIIKLALSLLFSAAAIYYVMFVDLGGKSLAEHASEVWHSEVVQQKVGKLESEAKSRLGQKLAEAASDAKERLQGKGEPQEQLSSRDRDALHGLIAGRSR